MNDSKFGNADRNALESLFGELKSRQFPMTGFDNAMREIHTDMAEYDGYIAGYALSVLNGDKGSLALFVRDLRIGESIRRCCAHPDHAEANLLREYEHYYSLLDRIADVLVRMRQRLSDSSEL